EDPVRLQVRDVGGEGGRVHGHQHVHRVPGCIDVPRREVDLEPAHSGQGAGRSADLRREVGEGGEIVAEEGGRVGELAARDLHAVAAVPAEADDRLVD